MVGLLLFATGCAGQSAAGSESATSVVPAAPTTTTSSTTTTTTTTSTTTTTTTTSTTTTTTTTTTVAPLPDPGMPRANAAFDGLAGSNAAASMTVVRDGRIVVSRASGTTIEGGAASSDSPMVVASVGKLLTAMTIARLDEAGSLDVDSPMPWADIAVPTHPGWADVTLRELLAHTSGMPVARPAWFVGGSECAGFLPTLLDRPPTSTRGRWTYSNGNYCALGLLIEQVTGLTLDAAAQAYLFDPIGSNGAHLTTDGQLPTDIEYRPGVERLSRLGGAGTFIVSTDDVAMMLATASDADLGVLAWPGVMIDQYGWGHTGTVDGALACVWVLEGGRTIVAATVAGRSPTTGGGICDRVVPAVADDLGIGQGAPDRSPP